MSSKIFSFFPSFISSGRLTLSPARKLWECKQEEAEKKARGLLEQLGTPTEARRCILLTIRWAKAAIALARAMMIDPEIIGYDEPTSALDPELRLEMEKQFCKIGNLGMTQIVVTHDLQFAENIADVLLK